MGHYITFIVPMGLYITFIVPVDHYITFIVNCFGRDYALHVYRISYLG